MQTTHLTAHSTPYKGISSHCSDGDGDDEDGDDGDDGDGDDGDDEATTISTMMLMIMTTTMTIRRPPLGGHQVVRDYV